LHSAIRVYSSTEYESAECDGAKYDRTVERHDIGECWRICARLAAGWFRFRLQIDLRAKGGHHLRLRSHAGGHWRAVQLWSRQYRRDYCRHIAAATPEAGSARSTRDGIGLQFHLRAAGPDYRRFLAETGSSRHPMHR